MKSSTQRHDVYLQVTRLPSLPMGYLMLFALVLGLYAIGNQDKEPLATPALVELSDSFPCSP